MTKNKPVKPSIGRPGGGGGGIGGDTLCPKEKNGIIKIMNMKTFFEKTLFLNIFFDLYLLRH